MKSKNLLKRIIPPDKLSQIILGGQDGLVNTFGVILGIAAASSDLRIVIAGGLAASIAESISMGAVAYTSQRAEHDRYLAELDREKRLLEKSETIKKERIKAIYAQKGFSDRELDQITDLIASNKQAFLATVLSEEAKLAPIETRDVIADSSIVFLSALLGALVPLFPFFFLSLKLGIFASFIISALTLFLFGFYKAKVTIGKPLASGIELLLIGMTAAILGYGIGYVFR